ncbi:MAG: hypothetical protein HDT43_00625 [Ruminococcaceae bacterium]|nr:hypothetical protein [Oscillospiraceae bacterium]
MKIMDMIVEEFNNNLTEEQKANGEKFERLNSKQVELVETQNGIVHRDLKTGKFTKI